MKTFLAVFFSILLFKAGAQTFTLGGDASLFMGSEGAFFFGGNTTLNGRINNQGTFVSFSDINFVNNTEVGSIKFNGTGNQRLIGEGLNFTDFVIEKEGELQFNGSRLFVSGVFSALSGEFQVSDDQELVFAGATLEDGEGYVEGRAIGRSAGTPMVFPMGIDGFPNYITLEGVEQGRIVNVRINQPDPSALLPDEDIVGIANQLEWVVNPEGEAVEATITVDFSGIDLENFTNGQEIRSEKYEPALVLFSREDTLYHTVPGFFVEGSDPQASTFGVYESAQTIRLSPDGERLAIALIPVIIRPHFFVPNSFAPYGTLEENRIFRPYFSGDVLTSVYMRVFDSFNKEVYIFDQSGDNIDLSLMGWNGTLPLGLEAPNGTYYYTVRLQTATDDYQQSGAVLLMR